MATRKAHNLETVLALCRFDPDSRNIGFEPFIKQELLRVGYPLTVRAMWVGIPPCHPRRHCKLVKGYSSQPLIWKIPEEKR